MCLSKWVLVIAVVVLMALSGCSHAASPVEPVKGEDAYLVGDKEGNQHSMLGLYTFICRPETNTIEVIPLRDADLHLNALKFLEPPAFLYLTIEGAPEFNGNILNVDIGLRHPFTGQDVYTGFDVCGIMFTHGSINGFNDPDIVMAGEGDTRLLNADGYTRWWNPIEFPHGDNVFSYIDGMFGNSADTVDFNCTVNGYKYFVDGLEKDDSLAVLDQEQRGVFSAGAKNIRHYKIDLSGGLVFNYAVDACWKKPSVIPPQNIPDDFPPAANRPEAWYFMVSEGINTLYYHEPTDSAGGILRLYLKAFDHFDAGESIVKIESLAGLPLTVTSTPLYEGNGHCLYDVLIFGNNLELNGDAEALITIESGSTGYGGALPGKPVCAYSKFDFHISPDKPPGWARTWGGIFNDECHGVATDEIGNVYAMGQFRSTVDFDPGPGVDEHTSGEASDIYLSKFDPNGIHYWVRTWGGPECGIGLGVAIDGNGDVYVTGSFCGTLDFDPGPGVAEYTSNGEQDIFLCKLNYDGDFLWARTWGGSDEEIGYGVTVDSNGDPHVTGFFEATADFDPGVGVDEHTSNGVWDAFLCKFDSDGDFQWAGTWGGSGYDSGNSTVVNESGDAYVTGYFHDAVDFDPGPGIDEHASSGNKDIFLSKFSSNGGFLWTHTWGALDDDEGSGVAVDGIGDAYFTGYFAGSVDFDPGPGIDDHVSNGGSDIVLCKIDAAGGFQWAHTWGGGSQDSGRGIDLDNNGYIYITGFFEDILDFDPGPGVDEQGFDSDYGRFLSRFDPSGDLLWARTWGASVTDYCLGLAVRGCGDAYVTGTYWTTVDFNPGPGVDEHSPFGICDAFLSRFPPDGNW